MTEPTVTIVDVEPKIITVVEQSTLAVEVTERGVPGPPGSTGPTGPAGPIGPQGVPGPGNAYQTVSSWDYMPAADAGNVGRAYYIIDTGIVMVSDGYYWRTMYGDTGLLNVRSLFTAPELDQAYSGTAATIRRYGNTVELYLDFKTGPVKPPSPFVLFAVPAGFRPTMFTYGLLYGYGGIFANIYGGGNGDLSYYGAVADDYWRARATWFTSDAWPVNPLPGILARYPN